MSPSTSRSKSLPNCAAETVAGRIRLAEIGSGAANVVSVGQNIDGRLGEEYRESQHTLFFQGGSPFLDYQLRIKLG